MTTKEKIEMIDRELTEPHSLSPEWVEMLQEYKSYLECKAYLTGRKKVPPDDRG